MRTSAPKHLFVILVILGIGQWWTEYGKCYLICTQQRNKSKTFLLKFNPPPPNVYHHYDTAGITTRDVSCARSHNVVVLFFRGSLSSAVIWLSDEIKTSLFWKRPQRFTLQLSCSFLLLLLFCFSRGHIRFPLPSSTTSLIGQRTACPQVRNMMSHGLITS